MQKNEKQPSSTETNEFTDEQAEVIKSIRTSRIIFPILIGLAVVGYMLYKQFNPEDFAKIQWTTHTLIWILFSLVFLVIRHFAYMARLYILTEGFFSWKKCFELIFIWEFSTAVSPTSVGGSAVALFMLSQEKLSVAKTTTIVIYTVVLDAAFFLIGLLFLYLIFGNHIIVPSDIKGIAAWQSVFWITYFVMLSYSTLFAYGIFIDPKRIKQFLLFFCKIPFLKRFRAKAEKLGNDIIIASKEVRNKKWTYHLGAFLSTVGAWTCRFILIGCLIIAFMPSISTDLTTNTLIFARLQSMFIILLLSPTPGGAGFAESSLGVFLGDVVTSASLALVVAVVWRFFTYYMYLFAGVIVIPNWIRKVINRKRVIE